MHGRFCTARHRGCSGLACLPRRLPFSFCLHLPLSLSAPLPLTLTLTVCLSMTQFLSLCASPQPPTPFRSVSLTFSFSQSFLGYLYVPVILSLTLVSLSCLSVFSSFLPLVTYLFLPPSSLLPRPSEHTNSQIQKRPGGGEHAQAHLLGTPRYRNLPAGSQRGCGDGGNLPLSGLWCRGAQCGAQGLASLPRVRGRCCQPERKEAAGLDSESCGRPFPLPRSLGTIS